MKGLSQSEKDLRADFENIQDCILVSPDAVESVVERVYVLYWREGLQYECWFSL